MLLHSSPGQEEMSQRAIRTSPTRENQNTTGSEWQSCGLPGFGRLTWLPFCICLFLPASSAAHPAGSGPSIRHVDHHNSSIAGLPACSFIYSSFFPIAFSGSLKKHPSQFILISGHMRNQVCPGITARCQFHPQLHGTQHNIHLCCPVSFKYIIG